mmetsp:Transcript_76071/g.235556  ORF Transcript_76071/g.235556 Transcript_76071/m.235556 type:complete len:224 (+) Transcript_76071:520-1191(+)
MTRSIARGTERPPAYRMASKKAEATQFKFCSLQSSPGHFLRTAARYLASHFAFNSSTGFVKKAQKAKLFTTQVGAPLTAMTVFCSSASSLASSSVIAMSRPIVWIILMVHCVTMSYECPGLVMSFLPRKGAWLLLSISSTLAKKPLNKARTWSRLQAPAPNILTKYGRKMAWASLVAPRANLPADCQAMLLNTASASALSRSKLPAAMFAPICLSFCSHTAWL